VHAARHPEINHGYDQDQMMAEFGEVVTDPRLRRGVVDEHLAASVSEPGLLQAWGTKPQ
jgi:hypothetical protein